MFENLQERFAKILKTLSGKGRLSEKNISDAVRQVKLSLLEADVNYRVVKEFIESVKQKALGEEVMKSFTPDQQFVKIVRDELIKIMGETHQTLNFKHNPSVIMIAGLQGSGKTTTCAKLALHLKKNGRNPVLVAADTYRPAAIEQLEKLGEAIGITVITGDRKNPVSIVKKAVSEAKDTHWDTVILDTAGRLHIDDEMMSELEKIKDVSNPDEVLMVVDAMTGQDAINSARLFDQRLSLTGFIVTKMDGDARGGVVLSIRHVTGKPVKFIGVGEKLDNLDVFHPERVASRILGMGDVLSLIEKAERELDRSRMEEMGKKLLKAEFTLEDFQQQLKDIKKLGPLSSLVQMLPGAPKINVEDGEGQLKKVEAIINSMTTEERRNPRILNSSRKKRITKGSGTTVQDINRLLKSYEEMKSMMKKLKKGKLNLPFSF